ncbi:protein of unknown function [Candidatus Nitrosotalea okcheonensis]|uniref:Uncharacterized protein n=1 Tax=Candidatus Nitrosotalea okcheonensis TaxID=1903276 RepID=A0A2H1FG02_9ARCH|nr:protein of unknown function [Candidatus Nitrosotalea okcheonensis]
MFVTRSSEYKDVIRLTHYTIFEVLIHGNMVPLGLQISKINNSVYLVVLSSYCIQLVGTLTGVTSSRSKV